MWGHVFAGFAIESEARKLCPSGFRMAMPHSNEDVAKLQGALTEAIEKRLLSPAWPQNTIWLGAQWIDGLGWTWDDGTAATPDWAKDQPSGGGKGEPFLCMVLDGKMHDTVGSAEEEAGAPDSKFGVICETGAAFPELPGPTSAISRGVTGTTYGRFRFLGFMGPQQAMTACGVGLRLAMPKNAVQMSELSQAVDAATKAGEMGAVWPQDTLWLGGRWDAAAQLWIWSDGSVVNETWLAESWAPGQPSSGPPLPAAAQIREPWLCLVGGHEVHDSADGSDLQQPSYKFAVFCEDSDRPYVAAPEALDDWSGTPVWRI